MRGSKFLILNFKFNTSHSTLNTKHFIPLKPLILSKQIHKYTNYQYTNTPITQNYTLHTKHYALKTQNSKLKTWNYSLPCFILAGGKSSRFGSEKDDKAYLFYDFQYNKCKKIFKKVYFVAKKKKFKNYPFFIEKSKIYAPIFALEELITKYKKIFVLSIDTPFINKKSLTKLLINKAIAKNNPLIGYYDYTMLRRLKKNKNKNLKISGINKKTLKIPQKELVNINKTEDLQRNIPYMFRKRFKRNIR